MRGDGVQHARGEGRGLDVGSEPEAVPGARGLGREALLERVPGRGGDECDEGGHAVPGKVTEVHGEAAPRGEGLVMGWEQGGSAPEAEVEGDEEEGDGELAGGAAEEEEEGERPFLRRGLSGEEG